MARNKTAFVKKNTSKKEESKTAPPSQVVKKTSSKVSSKAIKKTAPADGGVKKSFRYRPGTVALREIKRYQKSADLLFKRAPFQRLVKNVAEGICPDYRFQG